MNKQQDIIFALLGGLTSAVLLAAGMTGTLFALPLTVLSPLPVAIAGLGWGTKTGVATALVAGFILAISISLLSAFIYLAVFGLPIAYLAHTIGLSRQDNPDEPREWFPVDRVFMRAVLLSGAIIGVALIIAGFDVETVTQAVKEALAEILATVDEPTQKALEEGIAFQVWFTPYSLAIFWLLVIWLNLSLGVMIGRLSNKLERPSFKLREAVLSPFLLGGLVIACLISQLGPPVGFLGAAFVGSIAMAFVMLGFNTLHVLTEKNPLQGLIMGSLYGVTFLFGIPILFVFLIGIADLFFHIRIRHQRNA